MEIRVDSILDGTVKSITKFGAFVTLPGGRSGLVHISEISHSYVSEVSEHLKEGQEVRVKVVNIDDAGRINLSIKQTMEKPAQPARNDRPFRQDRPNRQDRPDRQGRPDRNDRQDRNVRNDRANSPNPQRQRPAHAQQSFRGPSTNQGANNQGGDFESMMKQFMQSSDNKLSSIRMQEKRSSRRSGHR